MWFEPVTPLQGGQSFPNVALGQDLLMSIFRVLAWLWTLATAAVKEKEDAASATDGDLADLTKCGWMGYGLHKIEKFIWEIGV